MSQIDSRLIDDDNLVGMNVIPFAVLFAGDYVCLDFRANPEAPSVAVIVGATNTNNFYLFNIGFASIGDVITITAAAGTSPIREIGGLTFDSFLPVPEPSSLVPASLGAIGLGFVARRKLRKNTLATA